MRGHSLRPRWRRGLISLVAGSAIAILLASPVSASIAHSGVVSATPAAFTPKVVLGTTGETVFAFAQVGTTMYVGGKFAQLRDSSGDTTYDRANFAAFNAKTGAMLPLTLPTNGRVEVIVPAPDGKAIYVGGTYTSIGGVTARGIVRYRPARRTRSIPASRRAWTAASPTPRSSARGSSSAARSRGTCGRSTR